MTTLTAQFAIQFPKFQFQVNLDLPLKGMTAVFGPSGCGKTTFLRCLAGLERSPGGMLRLGDDVWQDEARGIFLPISQRSIGYVFQEPRLFPHLTVRSNLEYGLRRTVKENQTLTLEKIVDILDLQHLLQRRPHKLSGGEQQRVAIGRALLTSPSLLLMDEPLSSLDVKRKREILPFIQRLDADLHIPIVYVTHSLQEVLQMATTLLLLKEGKVVGVGPLKEIMAQLDSRSFLDESQIGAVIDTTIEAHDEHFGLTKLRFADGNIYVPGQKQSIGQHLRVQILSKDVSIVTSPPAFQSSVLNILRATVIDIGPMTPEHPFVDIKLDIGLPLLATITRKSLASLRLHPGQQVYAQIKAVAFSQEQNL